MLLPLLLIAAPAVGAEAPPALITFNKPQPCNERQSGEKEIVVCGAMHTESPYLFCFPTLSGSRAMRIARGRNSWPQRMQLHHLAALWDLTSAATAASP